MAIKTDYLLVLKIINDNKREISLDLLYQKIVDLNDKRFEMWTRESFYMVIRRLELKKYISTELMKKIPTAKMITITKEAQDMLKVFESGPNQDIKKINAHIFHFLIAYKNRHEVFNETNRDEVIQDLVKWLDDDHI